MKLKIDTKRASLEGTGIFVRAQDSSYKWHSVDIAALEKESLLDWLQSEGGDNRIAENCVGILLGHGHLRGRVRLETE